MSKTNTSDDKKPKAESTESNVGGSKMVVTPQNSIVAEMANRNPSPPESDFYPGPEPEADEDVLESLGRDLSEIKIPGDPGARQDLPDDEIPEELNPEKLEALRQEQGTELFSTSHQGGHYRGGFEIEPIQYIAANNLPYAEGNIVKYVTRWSKKGGVDDLKKALWYLRFLIHREEDGVG